VYAEGLLNGSGPERVLLPNGEQGHSYDDVNREPQPTQANRCPRHRRPALVTLSNLGNSDIAENHREGARHERGDQPHHRENVERFAPVGRARGLSLNGGLGLWSFTHPLRVIVAG
jgi:hypothetical protein